LRARWLVQSGAQQGSADKGQRAPRSKRARGCTSRRNISNLWVPLLILQILLQPVQSLPPLQDMLFWMATHNST